MVKMVRFRSAVERNIQGRQRSPGDVFAVEESRARFLAEEKHFGEIVPDDVPLTPWPKPAPGSTAVGGAPALPPAPQTHEDVPAKGKAARSRRATQSTKKRASE